MISKVRNYLKEKFVGAKAKLAQRKALKTKEKIQTTFSRMIIEFNIIQGIKGTAIAERRQQMSDQLTNMYFQLAGESLLKEFISLTFEKKFITIGKLLDVELVENRKGAQKIVLEKVA